MDRNPLSFSQTLGAGTCNLSSRRSTSDDEFLNGDSTHTDTHVCACKNAAILLSIHVNTIYLLPQRKTPNTTVRICL